MISFVLFPKPRSQVWNSIYGNWSIYHFHLDHNASPKIYPPPPHPPPPKFCITIVFDFSWDNCNTQEKLKTMVMQNLGGKQGASWSVWKWWVLDRFQMTSPRLCWCTKQWNGSHVGVQKKSCEDFVWTLLSCKKFLLFQAICLPTDHVSENDLYIEKVQFLD